MLYKVPQPNSKRKYYPVPEKCYVALLTCATTRAVHLKLCRDATAHEFQLALKEFVARRAKPSMIISDNAKTFQATKRWSDALQDDQDLHNYLCKQGIEWKFNLSRAPCWEGFYERLMVSWRRACPNQLDRHFLSSMSLNMQSWNASWITTL